MDNDEHKYRVYDNAKKEYLPINDYFISPEGLLCFHQGKHRGEFKSNRYIKERSIGKKDKNGKLIFENDIVKSKQWNPQEYVVNFMDGKFCLCDIKDGEYIADIDMIYDSSGCQFEVVENNILIDKLKI